MEGAGEGSRLRTPEPSPPGRLGLAPEANRWLERAEDGTVCGALGCSQSPHWRVSHPDYGDRVVCTEHAEDLLSRHPDRPDSESPAARRAARNVEEGGELGATGGSDPAGTGRSPDRGPENPERCGREHTDQPARSCPSDPAMSGPCLLRHFSGSTALLVAGRDGEGAESGETR